MGIKLPEFVGGGAAGEEGKGRRGEEKKGRGVKRGRGKERSNFRCLPCKEDLQVLGVTAEDTKVRMRWKSVDYRTLCAFACVFHA